MLCGGRPQAERRASSVQLTHARRQGPRVRRRSSSSASAQSASRTPGRPSTAKKDGDVRRLARAGAQPAARGRHAGDGAASTVSWVGAAVAVPRARARGRRRSRDPSDALVDVAGGARWTTADCDSRPGGSAARRSRRGDRRAEQIADLLRPYGCDQSVSGRSLMTFAIGSLVQARDREWVVLPDSTDDLLMLRPLGGTDEEVTGILVPLERVESASFDPPDPTKPGDYRSGRLLRDAVRLGVAQHRRAVPLVRQHRRGAALVPARAAAHGAQAGPGAAAHRRRRGHRQDGGGAARRPRDARPRRRQAPHRALPAAPGASSGRGSCATSSIWTRSSCCPAR